MADLFRVEDDSHQGTLRVLALGPGYGESIVVRVPPGVLLVVDCFRGRERMTGQRNLVDECLAATREPVGAVILTHPHDDHAPGLGDIIQSHPNCLVGCCEPLWVTPYDRIISDPDLARRLSEGEAGQSLAAIRTAWGADPDRRWSLEAGSERNLGEALVTVLHPTGTALKAVEDGAIRARPNVLSSPILLEWRDLRLLLGADLERSAWPQVHCAQELGRHGGFKVAHHASRNASTRLRPILMTSLITLVVMIPVALFPLAGMDAYSPLGTVIVGGLLMGTVFSLIDIPIMHTLVDDAHRWWLVKVLRRDPASLPPV